MLWDDNKGTNQNTEDRQEKLISPGERASKLIEKMEALNSELDKFKLQSAELAEELRTAQQDVDKSRKNAARSTDNSVVEGELLKEENPGQSIIEAVKSEIEALEAEKAEEQRMLDEELMERQIAEADKRAQRAELKRIQAIQQQKLIERQRAEKARIEQQKAELKRAEAEKIKQEEEKKRIREEAARAAQAELEARAVEKVRAEAYAASAAAAEANNDQHAEPLQEAVEAAAVQTAPVPPVVTPQETAQNIAVQRNVREERRRRKQQRQMLIEQQRALQKRRREEARAEEKRLRRELSELKKADKLQRSGRAEAERAERAELRRQRKLAEKSAELGGGIVNVHGTTVKTEIRPVARFRFRDLISINRKQVRRNTETEKEYQEELRRAEERREAARQITAQLNELKWERRKNSAIGVKAVQFANFCERQKKPLLVAFSILLTVGVCLAGVYNYCAVYEYSYNGKTMGYVKSKDTVLRITDMIQDQLAKDKNMDVVIDARDDIAFQRKLNLSNQYTVDSADGVLKRLTYMGNVNVKAYGIFVNGKKVGAVEDKDTAANVLLSLEDRYASKKKGTEIKEVVALEDVQVRESNTKLENVLTEEGMIDRLCTPAEKETIHTVAANETLADIAKAYNIDENKLVEANEGVDPQNLAVGSAVVIKEVAPPVTVKITEVRTYEKTIKYETEKQKDKEMYKGDSEVLQKGKDGLNELTDRTVSVNGEVTETENLETIVKKEPVKKIMKVGTKKRPPTVGDKKYRWPAEPGTYTVTSEFKWRWGRQHQGIDMGCPVGTDVLAADGGTVTFAGSMGGYGNLVIIDHQNGHETYYGHNSSLCVKAGDKVYEGQHIAEAGNTGRSTGPHIHFGLMVNGTFINPREYLPSN